MNKIEDGLYKVKIRRDGKFKNLAKPETKKIDGKVFNFRYGWKIGKDDSQLYKGEIAMIPNDKSYPKIPITWIASGDLTKYE